MATWQHLRSSTANKRPTTSLADGRIAINTNTASPGLFFKDSAGTGIVKVGPVHVGTTAPNSVPASGGSTGNYLGEQWLDTSVSPAQMKVWNGSTWVGVVADELPVSKLQDGAARQLIQTDAAGTGVEWTSNVDVPGTLDVTSTATFDSIAQHPLGSAAAPTLTFTGDNNTGIYSPGADQVAVATNGTGRLFVDASGNVGINNASSSYALSVAAPGTSTVQVLAGGTTNLSRIQFGDSAALGPGYIWYNHADDSLQLGANSGERLRITSAGNVGIGTTAPGTRLEITPSTAEFDGIKVSRGPTFESSQYGIINHHTGAFKFTSVNTGIPSGGGFVFSRSANGTTATESARIDSSGRLLVGTSTSRVVGGAARLLQVEGVDAATTSITTVRNGDNAFGPTLILGKTRSPSNGNNNLVSQNDQLGVIQFAGADGVDLDSVGGTIKCEVDGTPGADDMPGRLVFSTTADGASTPTEAVRIDSNQRVGIGVTAIGSYRLHVANNGLTTAQFRRNTSTGGLIDFNYAGSAVGSISTDGTATAYNTSSDYRLKENVTPVSDGITRLQQLKPSRFNFIADPAKTVDGFIAHEVQAVVPEAITGEKDAVDDEGNPEYQGIDQSKLAPLLTAALQEAIAKIETLEGMVAVNNITIDEQQHQLSTLAARLTALESA